jgi:uncharacterized protein (DUF305 family)
MARAASPEAPASPEPPVQDDSGRRTRLAIAAILTAVALVTASLVIGRLSAPGDTDPGDTSVEAGFARDMQVHHQQAVEMAMMIRDATDDPDVRLLAYDIATSQSQQAGQMFGWLAEWGLPQASTQPSMTWMSRPTLEGGHGHESAHEPGAPMPGLATREQIVELGEATGVEAERLFLELMIAHHQGGVEMAEAVIERTRTTVVLDLATSIIAAQTSEIGLMTDMLEARQ